MANRRRVWYGRGLAGRVTVNEQGSGWYYPGCFEFVVVCAVATARVFVTSVNGYYVFVRSCRRGHVGIFLI